MSMYMSDTFLLIYEKFHFQELLRFVIVRQYTSTYIVIGMIMQDNFPSSA